MDKYFDVNGKEVEAYSKEGLEEKNKEAIAAYLEKNPDKTEDLKTSQDELAVAKAKVAELEEAAKGDGGKNKEGDEQQKQRLKEAKDAADEAAAKVQKDLDDYKNGVSNDLKTKALDKFAGNDPELRAKIELEFDGFKGDAVTESEIGERAARAYTLAKGEAPTPDIMDGKTNAGDKGSTPKHNSGKAETENSKAQREAMGITDKDVEEHGNN